MEDMMGRLLPLKETRLSFRPPLVYLKVVRLLQDYKSSLMRLSAIAAKALERRVLASGNLHILLCLEFMGNNMLFSPL